LHGAAANPLPLLLSETQLCCNFIRGGYFMTKQENVQHMREMMAKFIAHTRKKLPDEKYYCHGRQSFRRQPLHNVLPLFFSVSHAGDYVDR